MHACQAMIQKFSMGGRGVGGGAEWVATCSTSLYRTIGEISKTSVREWPGIATRSTPLDQPLHPQTCIHNNIMLYIASYI